MCIIQITTTVLSDLWDFQEWDESVSLPVFPVSAAKVHVLGQRTAMLLLLCVAVACTLFSFSPLSWYSGIIGREVPSRLWWVFETTFLVFSSLLGLHRDLRFSVLLSYFIVRLY